MKHKLSMKKKTDSTIGDHCKQKYIICDAVLITKYKINVSTWAIVSSGEGFSKVSYHVNR